MTKPRIVNFVIIISLCLTLTCACKQSIQHAIYEVPGSSQKILITGNTSEFKDKILENIVDNFKTKCQIEILTYNMLDEVNYNDYAAILVMDECRAWMKFTKKAIKVVDQVDDKDKIILFLTSDDPDWEYVHEGVEAITSASEDNKIDKISGDIIFEIDKLLPTGQ